jgi:hypothetical protein
VESLIETKKFELVMKGPIYSLKKSKLRKYMFSDYFNPQPNTEMQTLASQTKAMTQTIGSTSMSFSLVSNPSACWTLLNTIQIISYLPLNSLPYTPKLKSFHASLTSYNLLPNPFEYFVPPNSSSEPFKQAKKFGIDSSVFLLNFGNTLMIPLAYIVIFPLLYALSCITKISPYVKKYLVHYKFNFFIRFIIQSYLEVGIYSLIQLRAVIIT